MHPVDGRDEIVGVLVGAALHVAHFAVHHEPADGVHHRAHAAVGAADEKLPVLDGAQLREREVLPRLSRGSEPGVVW